MHSAAATTTAAAAPPAAAGQTLVTAASPTSGVRIKFVSDRGAALAGITITLTPSNRTGTSGADGIATIAVSPGSYTGVVANGCHHDYYAEHAATAHFAVPSNQVVDGTLEVAAVRRVAPAKPSDIEGDGIWKAGTSHRVTFATVDRCNGQPARNLSMALTTFVPGPGYKLVGTPPGRTFDDGRSYVDVACTSGDTDPSLIARAKEDDRDQIDLLSIDVLQGNPPNCVS